MYLRKLIAVISISLGAAACQTSGPTTTSVSPSQIEAGTAIETVDPQISEVRSSLSAPTDLWERIRRELSWQSIDHPTIQPMRERFLAQSTYLPVVSERAELYLFYIVQEVEKRDMPMEIALLPLVESTLNPFAYSSERAAGLWQIMPATGRHLGLQQDWWYDGRLDIRESTRAALDYLESLHKQFDQDWLLALAAYNSGKGRVARARRDNAASGLSTDYWSLTLPRETRNYVPKLVALSQIIASPDTYGVTIPNVANKSAFEVAATGGQIEMARAAQLAGVELETLRALNPGQLRWATSPDMAPELLLPVGNRTDFERGIAQLSPDDRVQWQHYRIARGDNLIGIARKFDTQVGLLREVNGIRGSKIRAGDTLMIPKGSSWSASLAMADSKATQTRGYRVRRGDSLYRIAGKFNVSIDDIVAWNSLDRTAYLQPGQTLTLHLRGG